MKKTKIRSIPMGGRTIVILIAVTIFIVVWIREKTKSSSARTGHLDQELRNRNVLELYTDRTASGLPPVRRPVPAVPMQTRQHPQPPRLPAYRRTLESIYEFPHCPKCWSNNRLGEVQAVFWLPSANCFQCRRGHRFRRNGKLI